MPLLHIDGHYYRYGSEQVVDQANNTTGFMGFIAPATNPDGSISCDASFLTYQIPPGPLLPDSRQAEQYAFTYIVLNHRRQHDGTGFPVGSRVGNRKTGQVGTVCQAGMAVCVGFLAVDFGSVGVHDVAESDLVLVPA